VSALLVKSHDLERITTGFESAAFIDAGAFPHVYFSYLSTSTWSKARAAENAKAGVTISADRANFGSLDDNLFAWLGFSFRFVGCFGTIICQSGGSQLVDSSMGFVFFLGTKYWFFYGLPFIFSTSCPLVPIKSLAGLHRSCFRPFAFDMFRLASSFSRHNSNRKQKTQPRTVISKIALR
jgi:hypothetical protein